MNYFLKKSLGGAVMGASFAFVAIFISISYAALNYTVSVNTASLGSALSALEWNKIVSNITAIDGQLTTMNTVINNTLGVGQTWQDVTASRVSSDVYTNSTSKPIFVMVQALGTVAGAGQTLTPVVGGVTLPSQYDSVVNIYGYCVATSFIVPPGSTYKVTASQSSGSPTITKWVELR